MAELFGKTDTAPVKAVQQEGNTSPESVETKESGDTETSEESPKYTAKQMEAAILERLRRAESKHKKELEAIKGTTKTPVKESLEEEWKTKLNEYETQLKAKDEAINKYKTTSLQKTVSAALSAAECVDPELVAKDLISSGRVVIDEETGEVVVESITGQVTVSEIVVEYAKKKPYLFKSNSKGGLGTKAPSGVSSTNSREEELRQLLGINSQKDKSKLFGR